MAHAWWTYKQIKAQAVKENWFSLEPYWVLWVILIVITEIVLHLFSDLGVFYFLCIIQHGPHEFYCTKVLSTNDATDGNFLLFPDKFTL